MSKPWLIVTLAPKKTLEGDAAIASIALAILLCAVMAAMYWWAMR